MKKKNYKKIILLSVVFLFFLGISYLFPYTNDDWAWASKIGINRLNNFFENYNGRYLGNLLVLLLTRHRMLRAIVIAICLTMIINFVSRTISKKNITIFLIVSLLMVLLPQPIFRQAIAWTSGFTNYVPPILFTIIWIYLTKNVLEDKEVNISKWWILPIFILGVCTCLFMEHVTIYIVCLSVLTLVYCLIKKIKTNPNQISFFVGNIVGAFIMFQNEAYHHVLKGDDFYREVPKDGLILQSIKRYFYTIYDNLIMNNTLILVIITICLVFLFYKFIYKNKEIKNIKIAVLSLGIIIFYSIYSLIAEFFPNWEVFELVYKAAEGLLTAIYFVALVIFIFFLPNKEFKKKLYFFLGSIVFMTGPLLIVSPVTPRCFYPMYILWIIFAILLVNECFKYIKSDSFYRLLNYILSCTILISMFYTSCIIFSAYHVTNRMIDYIEVEKINNSKEIVIPKTVYEDYMKHPYPHNEENMERFKLYYEIPKDVQIKIVDYKTWHDMVESE